MNTETLTRTVFYLDNPITCHLLRKLMPEKHLLLMWFVFVAPMDMPDMTDAQREDFVNRFFGTAEQMDAMATIAMAINQCAVEYSVSQAHNGTTLEPILRDFEITARKA